MESASGTITLRIVADETDVLALQEGGDFETAERTGTLRVEFALPATSGGEEDAVTRGEGGGVDFFQGFPGGIRGESRLPVRALCRIDMVSSGEKREGEEAENGGDKRAVAGLCIHFSWGF